MKLAIVGGRDFNNKEVFSEAILNFSGKISEIVSGGASGADTLAEEYAKANSIRIVTFLPDWKTYGRAAGPMRNKLIIEYADECLAFWDGVSKGTKSSISLANKKGIPVHVYRY